ncbi:MAG: hypothetical protein JSW67_11265 [Candidatus Latescibacterota bacterium]|nr:MAG: hypothetical protein JSW67_11265 [Candidatus Latescibacterota bacterium]
MSLYAWHESAKPATVLGSRHESESSSVQPCLEAVQCLREAAVPFALMHAPSMRLQQLSQLDVLVEPSEREIACAALRRAGYREMHRAADPTSAWRFLRYDDDRFHAVALHEELGHQGMRYMDAAVALRRSEQAVSTPFLALEDRVLHVLQHNLLRRRHPSPAEIAWLRGLMLASIDRDRIAEQCARFGTAELVTRALDDLSRLLESKRRWRLLGARLHRALLRDPANRKAFWRCWRAEHLRLFRRPVVVAVLGPPAAGKSALAAAIAKQLSGTPLEAESAALGAWGESRLGRSLLSRLAPTQDSWGRVLLARRGRRIRLSANERRLLESGPGLVQCALRTGLERVRNALFHATAGAGWLLRYARRVARCRSPLVVADGWIYDLGCRLGRTHLTQGEPLRRRFYRWLPAPDGILYISTTYEIAGARDRSLRREQFVGVDRAMRQLLHSRGPLEVISDASADEMSRTFLRRYWAHVLGRYNQRS